MVGVNGQEWRKTIAEEEEEEKEELLVYSTRFRKKADSCGQ